MRLDLPAESPLNRVRGALLPKTPGIWMNDRSVFIQLVESDVTHLKYALLKAAEMADVGLRLGKDVDLIRIELSSPPTKVRIRKRGVARHGCHRSRKKV